jgi:hypothetical protein
LDLIKDEKKLKDALIKDWKSKFEGKITKKENDSLTTKLKKYLTDFDFSIIHTLEPVDFINQFQTTSFYPYYFGGGLTKKRNLKFEVSASIADREINYVNQLFQAYQDYSKEMVKKVDDIKENQELKSHFDRSRNCFYFAETLAQFSRDNIASEIDSFEELKDEVFEQVVDVCNQEYKDGYKKSFGNN